MFNTRFFYDYTISLVQMHLVVILCLFSIGLSAQRGIGSWKIHVPYSESVAVAQSGSKIYSASKSGLFVYDVGDNSIEKIDKVSGLSDVDITAMAYQEHTKTMIIGYRNGNIDLIKNNRIINLPDLRRSFIQADKRINRIFIDSTRAYLACNFGVLEINTQRAEVSASFFPGAQGSFIRVHDLTVLDNQLYIATEDGIKRGSLQQNLSDFQNWEDVSPVSNRNYNAIVTFQGDIVANLRSVGNNNQDQLYRFRNNAWEFLNLELYDKDNVRFLDVFEERLVMGSDFFYRVFDTDYVLITNGFNYQESFLPPNPNQVIFYNGYYWVADNRLGLVKTSGAYDGEIIAPNGPPTGNVFGITNIGNQMWFTGGAVTANWSGNFRTNGIYRLEDKSWELFKGSGFDTIRDILQIVPNPKNVQEKFLCSWGSGLVRTLNGQIQEVYRANNSTVRSIDLFPFFGITSAVFDDKNVLWVCNSGVPSQRIQEPLLAFDGENWLSFRLGSFVDGGQHVSGIAIDQRGYKWIQSFRNGIIVFNDNGTLAHKEDDQVVYLGTSEGRGNLPSSEVRDLAVDKDDVIWVATDKGLVLFRNPQNVFNPGGIDAEKIIIEDGENFSYLLDGLFLNKIYVDGANRKWIGTFGSGVYLISANGRDIVHHFTTQNSPLISDNVLNIEINEQTGEVYFATENGLVSFKGNATESEVYTGQLYAYPNPVHPGYEGEIGIKGLSKNAEVKITDISGNIVFETFANGGMAAWNGKDFNGRKVQSGVYLVMAANTDGTQTSITKILFINGK